MPAGILLRQPAMIAWRQFTSSPATVPVQMSETIVTESKRLLRQMALPNASLVTFSSEVW